MDNYSIKILGTAEIDRPLNQESDLDVINGKFGIYSITKKSNDDGTNIFIYALKPLSHIEFNQDGKKIIGSDKRKWSKKLYDCCWHFGVEYDLFMPKLLANLEDTIEFLKNK